MKNLLFILSLVVVSNNVVNAQKLDSLKQLTSEALNYELIISKKVANQGETFYSNYQPAAKFVNKITKSVIKVIYADEERTKPINFIIWKDGKYFWDKTGNGSVDGILIDQRDDSKALPNTESFMKTEITMANPTQTELDLSDMMGIKFMYVDLSRSKAYSTEGAKIFQISDSQKESYEFKFQKKYLEILKTI